MHLPITVDHPDLQTNAAPGYWAFAVFNGPQFTSSTSGVSSVTAAVDGLNGGRKAPRKRFPPNKKCSKRVGDKHWSEISAQDGDGVKFNVSSFNVEAIYSETHVT